ncbi:MAG TPA: excinuclease ABC subunit UvrC [Syntrophales bacterium]|nr:excinuclease ABC subunit UvrC [Syntrophales bacterium]
MDRDNLKEKLKSAPRSTGVYIMKDGAGRVIYVGKAKNLRARVRTYMDEKDARPMIPFLVPKISDIEYIMTDSEKEALLLENNLIKAHRPRYNVIFRDDKDYFSLRIDRGDPFPRLELVRRPKRDGALYFGPFSSGGAVKETLGFLQRLFPLRTCKKAEFKSRKRPCIEYEIRRCLAPCCGYIDAETYNGMVGDVVLFMEGRGKGLVADLKRRMSEAARSQRYEEAGRIRDMIGAIETTLERQKAFSMSHKDQDVFGIFREGDLTQVGILFVRKGKWMGSRSFPVIRSASDPAEIISSVLKQYYGLEMPVPDEIIVPARVEDRAVVSEWLSEKKGARVSIETPRRGKKKALADAAVRNAESVFRTLRRPEENAAENAEALARELHLKKIPRRIECIDISNIGGRMAVGSKVAFQDGAPDKSGYRHFRIRDIEGMDDYGMMLEVLRRRFAEMPNPPDLLIMDGGKGQLQVALRALKESGLSGIDVIGLAKETREFRREQASGGKPGSVKKTEDRVYIPGRKDPIYLSRRPEILRLLQMVRNEAHRFAVSYHRRLMMKRDRQSVLDEIPGIGTARKKELIGRFGDIEGILNAGIEELTKIPGITGELGRTILEYLKEANSETQSTESQTIPESE